MTAPISAVPLRRVVPVVSPAAGAEFTLRNNGLGVWLVLALSFTLATSAAVANRFVRVIADDGSTEYLRSHSIDSQAASLTWTYSGFTGQSGRGQASGSLVLPWPTDGVHVDLGGRLRSSTVAIDAADQYSAIAALVAEYPAGRFGRFDPGPAPTYRYPEA